MSNKNYDSLMGEISQAQQLYDATFNTNRYKQSTVGTSAPGRADTATAVRHYLDGSDALANEQKMVVSIQHVASGNAVFFKAFINTLNEAYSPDWTEDKIYGRSDPVYMYKNTTRKITLSFKVPAGSESEAYENLARVQKLVQFLYPNYEDIQDSPTIAQSPFVRLKVMNIIQKVASHDHWELHGGRTRKSEEQIYNEYRSDYSPKFGALGAITNLTLNHNLETEDGAFIKTTNTILPKYLEVNIEFTPVHEAPLGWNATEDGTAEFASPYHPYKALASDPFKKYAAGKTSVDAIIQAATAAGLDPKEQQKKLEKLRKQADRQRANELAKKKKALRKILKQSGMTEEQFLQHARTAGDIGTGAPPAPEPVEPLKAAPIKPSN
jgi:hypothetical protein